jgi:hypothetical protein
MTGLMTRPLRLQDTSNKQTTRAGRVALSYMASSSPFERYCRWWHIAGLNLACGHMCRESVWLDVVQHKTGLLHRTLFLSCASSACATWPTIKQVGAGANSPPLTCCLVLVVAVLSIAPVQPRHAKHMAAGSPDAGCCVHTAPFGGGGTTLGTLNGRGCVGAG